MSFRLIKAQRTKTNTVLIFARDEEGRKLCFPVEAVPYFFVESLESPTSNSPEIVDSELGYQSIYGEELRKIIVTNPSVVPQVRERFSHTYEADVKFARRCLINLKISSGFDNPKGIELVPCSPPEIPIRVGYLDIEVLSENNKMPDSTQDTITCVTLSDGNEYFTAILDDLDFESEDSGSYIGHFSSEKKLLEKVLALIDLLDLDVICAWNSEFDFEYLQKRAERYNLLFPLLQSLRGINSFDLLSSYRRLYRRRSYRLKDIVIEEGLTTESEEQVNYAKLWENDKPGLIERNKRHVKWLVQINEKLKITDYYWSLKEFAGVESLEDCQYSSVLIDTLLLRNSPGILPSKEQKEHEVYEGAFILKPQAAVLDSVAFFDLARFYPTCILNNLLDPIILNSYLKWKESGLTMEEYIESL